VKHCSPARVSTYAYVNPIIAVFLGWLLAGEPVSPRLFGAAAIIIAGVAIITATKGKRAPVIPTGQAVNLANRVVADESV
jgi:drug/metabolite transporter (DMT)-like permease